MKIEILPKEEVVELFKKHNGFITQIGTDPDENGKPKYMKVELANGYAESICPRLHIGNPCKVFKYEIGKEITKISAHVWIYA